MITRYHITIQLLILPILLTLFFSSCEEPIEKHTYTVTFESNKGSIVQPQTLNEKQKAIKPADPTRTGYVFGGWYVDNGFQQAFDFNSVITADITLYAQWTDNLTVTFDTDEGGSVVQLQTVEKGQKATKPAADPKRLGYLFVGWYTDKNFQKIFDFANTAITVNITLYAKWDEGYSVIFDSRRGSTIESVTVAKGGTLNAPTPSPTLGNSALMAWYTDEAFTRVFDFSNTINANITLYAKYGFKVPDENFRNYLKRRISAAFIGDVMDTSLTAVTGIDSMKVSNLGIRSLEGIEYFTSLAILDCSKNRLDSLGISKNTALKELVCFNNSLSSLDMSKNTKLEKSSCSFNLLRTLNVSENVVLKELLLFGNRLTSLDISKNTALEGLSCAQNRLTSLDVSKNTALKELSCSDNKLTSLDMSKNTALEDISCSENKLTSLDMSKNTALKELFCDNNQLTDLDLSRNTALKKLFCIKNKLVNLDIRGGASLDRGLGLTIEVGESGWNLLRTLKIPDAVKDYNAIKVAKTSRGAEITITTYNNSDRTTVICNDYDPNGAAGAGNCIQGP